MTISLPALVYKQRAASYSRRPTPPLRSNMTKQSYNIVVGASGGIGSALAKHLENEPDAQLITISRKQALPGINSQHFSYAPSPSHADRLEQNAKPLEAAITACLDKIKAKLGQSLNIDRIFIATGVLHSSHFKPEKRLEDLNELAATQVFQINSLLPILWCKHLYKICATDNLTRLAVLSARVGSIGDNHLGGWYSYRASKAHLNMLLKTLSIELARRAKHISMFAVHPGTVDTELSKPFQQRVPSGKLFDSGQSAKYMLTEIDARPHSSTLQFLDWQGKSIPW